MFRQILPDAIDFPHVHVRESACVYDVLLHGHLTGDWGQISIHIYNPPRFLPTNILKLIVSRINEGILF